MENKQKRNYTTSFDNEPEQEERFKRQLLERAQESYLRALNFCKYNGQCCHFCGAEQIIVKWMHTKENGHYKRQILGICHQCYDVGKDLKPIIISKPMKYLCGHCGGLHYY